MMTEEQKKALIARCNYLIGGAPEIDVQLAEFALDALTQPASPALKLPDEMDADHPRMRWVGMGELWGRIQGWNDCLEEVKRLNAPHTAPIEPIRATGGAEWVKCSERMPDEEGNDGLLLVCCGGVVKAGFYDRWDKFSDGEGYSFFSEVTHWMPLPSAPKP